MNDYYQDIARALAQMIHRRVRCCVCGREHDPGDPAVRYRSLDQRWQCADERACHDLAIARTTAAERAAMFRALDAAWERLEKEGWRI